MGARQLFTEELPACRVDPDLKHAVTQLAARMDRPVSFVQRRALRELIDREKKGKKT